MGQGSDDIAGVLSGATAYIHTLPEPERRMAMLAAGGVPVYEIAQEVGITEAAVWRTLSGVLAAVTGRQVTPVETAGLGADTDPGVTGGYGDTGFGALDTEPVADSSEPLDGGRAPE
ncbi:MAG: sigma-70 region 4 domain-containing protein [Chloroflexota bacterium]|nr:sigma-70 region 4 domain-containing protein [Chloroflexota bacterium]